jgi:hypothetical protein
MDRARAAGDEDVSKCCDFGPFPAVGCSMPRAARNANRRGAGIGGAG